MALFFYICLGLLLLHEGCTKPHVQENPADDEAEHDNSGGDDDMILPPGQKAITLLGHDLSLWPGGIVYYKFDKNFPKDKKKVMKKAMRKVENALKVGDMLCIDFLVKKNSYKTTDYLAISEPSGNTCAAGLGRFPAPYSTPLYFGDYCSLGNMMHELLHTLGVIHEHKRPDRDDYVKVKYENIASNAVGNFYKEAFGSVTDMDTHYDYFSIMHYGPYAFTSNGEVTIKPRDKGVQLNGMGQRVKLTACDIEKIQLRYGCKSEVEVCQK